MDLSLDCIPCFVRHALDMVRIASGDAAIHEQVLREVLLEAAGWDRTLPAKLRRSYILPTTQVRSFSTDC
jgi:hypothetical protein